MSRHNRVTLLAASLPVVFLVGAATAAFAYWTTTGTGAVAATVGPLEPVVIAALAGEGPSSTLVPSGPSTDVVVKVTNPNPFDVTVVGVSLIGAVTAGNGCSPTGVSLVPPANLPVTVPPGTSVVHLAGAASMDSSSATACQGASFSFPVTLTVYR